MIADHELMAQARLAAANAYAPHSNFPVGAALYFADGSVITGSNVENISFGLSLCAETNAVAKAMNDGRRGGLLAVAVCGPEGKPISPCGRCRQVLAELAGLDESDPLVWCDLGERISEIRLSELLPAAFRSL